MLRLLIGVTVVLALAAVEAGSAPVKGARAIKVRVGTRSQTSFEERFEGGRRACVIAQGDQDPSAEVAIAVYDEANQVVVEDRGVDFAAAIWYPPRDAKYKVEVKNGGPDVNIIYVVFK
jgi:hypothetical protein